jgi:hypothetical protein
MANERLNHNPGEREKSSADLESARAEHQDRIREQLEKSAETKEKSVGEATKEALEKATSHEREKSTQKHEKQVEKHERRRDGPLSKKAQAESFNRTMKQVRKDMSAPSRAFSAFIHNKTVENVSNAVGSTVARPNAVLSGSIFAFLFTLVVFLIAKNYGYPLSGAETIASFAVGWAVGLLYDYLRLMITGRPS